MAIDADHMIELLACDISARPSGAPGVDQLTAHTVAIRRTPAEVIVTFDAGAGDMVANFAAAEQLCCSSLSWLVEREPAVTLTVRATPAQLDAIELMFAQR